MKQSSNLPSFFITEPAPCPYLDGLLERKLFTHLAGDAADEINNNLTHAGFRRSQSIAYRPACDGCSACRSVRVKADSFHPSKSFRRIRNRNADLIATETAPDATREQYDLLRRYLESRHADGGMSDMTPMDYMAMVEETCVKTQVVEYRDAQGALIACLLRDTMNDGLSLIYSFFDPQVDRPSLGSFIILNQIATARARGLPYVYLGYLIENCSKMSYKKRFSPLQALGSAGWQDYTGTVEES
tara:strand:+ start:412 stop:1143 length:732 start_codon:yes stop_codon:yes gene_type:complete